MRILLLLGLLAGAGCRSAADDPPAPPPAAGRGAPPAAAFDADSAWAALERQVAFGPRVPGTPAHRACGDWLAAEMRRHGGRVTEDRFEETDAAGRRWPLRNILARFGPDSGPRLLWVAHWDTRPWADLDPDPARRGDPIPGANDGASGVAVLLELARQFSLEPPALGVDLLLVDGEDLGSEEDPDAYCLGSKRFAGGDLSAYRCAVVLDMVAERDTRFPVEAYSLHNAPRVVDWVWARGEALSPGTFPREVGEPVYDDHVPFLEAGLPAVDVIDFDYWAWHTLRDDLRAVSRASLAAVGRVAASLSRDTELP